MANYNSFFSIFYITNSVLVIWFDTHFVVSSVFLTFTSLMLLLICVFQKSNIYLQEKVSCVIINNPESRVLDN